MKLDRVPTWLTMPLAPAYVALAVWPMVKGFEERPSPERPVGQGAAQ
jgi:hypothetical protein